MPDTGFPHFQSDTDTVIPVSVVRGIPPGQYRAALHLFWNAFSRKLRFTLGTEKKTLRFLERCIDPKQTVCAINSAGQLAGLLLLKVAIVRLLIRHLPLFSMNTVSRQVLFVH